MSGNRQNDLINHYQKLAQELLSGTLAPAQFAEKLANLHLELEKRAYHDGLINNFLNSNGFIQTLEKWLQLIARLEINGVLLALDIDSLKKFNDTQGHVAGDQLIKIYANVIEQQTRVSDLKGRLGGDEFAVFLVGSNIDNAQVVAERMRTGIIEEVKRAFPHLPWEQTISIGIAEAQKNESAQNLRLRADKALYEAKKERNKVVIYESSPVALSS